MIPISVEHAQAIDLAARYCSTLAAVERAYALGDMDEVEAILGNVEPVELRMTADTLYAIARLWHTITGIRGGTTGVSGRSTSAPSPHATASGPSAPDNVVELHGYSKKVICS